MKYDEFAFFNQQLAAMLRDGIPLEGALRRLCEDMQRGPLREELQSLEADLARGTPIAEALKARRLPELYKRIVLLGVKSGDLPAALTMLADHFHWENNLWMRLKGLMVYPIIVLVVAFILSCSLSYLLEHFILSSLSDLTNFYGRPILGAASASLWLPPLLFGAALLAAIAALVILPARQALRWKLPGFKEASLADIGNVVWLMLKNGVPLSEALQLAEQLEAGTAAGREIAGWRQNLAAGGRKFTELAPAGAAFPPLFIWTVAQAGEDLATGFKRTAELYQARAAYRAEMILYSALPCAIIFIAILIISQIQPVMHAVAMFISALGNN